MYPIQTHCLKGRSFNLMSFLALDAINRSPATGPSRRMVPISPPVHGLSVASGLTSTLIHMAHRSTLLRLRDDGQLDAAGLQQLAALAMPQPDSTLVSQAKTGRGVAAMLRLVAMSQVPVVSLLLDCLCDDLWR
jgi:hypothetical protein